MALHPAHRIFLPTRLVLPLWRRSATSAGIRKDDLFVVTCLGLATYTLLLILAVIYYLERTVFADIAFHLFSLIMTENWTIQNFRFGALFTQFLPLLGIKLGVSLQSLLLSVGLVSLFIWSVRHRNWMTIGWVIVILSGYSLLVNTSYPNEPVQFYSENLLLPLSLFILAPLIFQVLPRRLPGLVWWVLGALILIRLGHIQQTHSLYTERLDWMRNYMVESERTGPLKLIVHDSLVPMDTLLMALASPYEFWLLSTVETGTTASIVFTDHPRKTEWAAGQGDVFISTWGVFPNDQPNPQYFHFQDNLPYRFARLE